MWPRVLCGCQDQEAEDGPGPGWAVLRWRTVKRQVRKQRLTGRSYPSQNPCQEGASQLPRTAWGGRGHRAGPRAPVMNVNSLLQKLYQADTSQETERPPDSTHAMPDTGHVPTQPRGCWLWGSGQVAALLGPVSRSCGKWASPGPPWAGGVPRPHRPGLHWALTKPPRGGGSAGPSAKALWLSPALLGALETHHFLWEPCADEEAEAALGTTAAVPTAPSPRASHGPAQGTRPPSS